MKIADTMLALAACTFLTAGAAMAASGDMNGMTDQGMKGQGMTTNQGMGMDRPATGMSDLGARPMTGRSMSHHHKMMHHHMMMKKHHMMMKKHHMMMHKAM